MTTAVCCGCKRETEAPVPVRYIESPTGPGRTLYACPDCAPLLTPGPLPGKCRTAGTSRG